MRRLVLVSFLVCGTALATEPEAPGATHTLSELLAYADTHAPGVIVARAKVGLGDAAIAGAAPSFPENPDITLAAGPRIGQSVVGLDVQASIAQTLEVAGEQGLRRDAARARRDALDRDVEVARWETHRAVHAAFHLALVARERVASASRARAFAAELLQVAQRRVTAGDASPLVVELAAVEVTQAEQAAITVEQDWAASRLALAQAAGWPPSDPPEPAGTLEAPRRSAPAAVGSHQERTPGFSDAFPPPPTARQLD